MSTSKGSAAGSIRQAVVTTLVLLLICGFLFPVLMTGLGSLIFPSQAGGNLIYVDGQPVGLSLIHISPAGSVFLLEKAVQLAHRPESDGPDKQRPAHQYQSFHKITSLKMILLQALFV